MNKIIKTGLLLAMLASAPASLFAVPDGYSINSDSGSINADSLYRIDLANGSETRIGPVVSLGQARIDVEGLAFSPDGKLYGVDDSSLKLFPLNIANGAVESAGEVDIRGLPTGGSNDFGMTFACDDNLYLTSVTKASLYRLDLDGTTTLIGNEGSLGADISSLAAYGNPVRLYGLSNGLNSPALYEIDIETGVATKIGNLGAAAASYNESGLAFDEAGVLWAITDRRAVSGGPFASDILRINTTTGQASKVATTTEQGFESLAISIPEGCDSDPGQGSGPDVPEGQNLWVDMSYGAPDLPLTLAYSCNMGQPLNESVTLDPIDVEDGKYRINFRVRDFDDGAMRCDVWVEYPTGVEWDTVSCTVADSDCAENPVNSFVGCRFTGIEDGDENLCEITLKPEAVDILVNKVWIDENEAFENPTYASARWKCSDARNDATDSSLGETSGKVRFYDLEDEAVFEVFPNVGNGPVTECTISESRDLPGVLIDDSDCADLEILPGQLDTECTIYNTRLYEGVPTLGQYGLWLFTALMLFSGLLAARRI